MRKETDADQIDFQQEDIAYELASAGGQYCYCGDEQCEFAPLFCLRMRRRLEDLLTVVCCCSFSFSPRSRLLIRDT